MTNVQVSLTETKGWNNRDIFSSLTHRWVEKEKSGDTQTKKFIIITQEHYRTAHCQHPAVRKAFFNMACPDKKGKRLLLLPSSHIRILPSPLHKTQVEDEASTLTGIDNRKVIIQQSTQTPHHFLPLSRCEKLPFIMYSIRDVYQCTTS